MVNYSHRKMKEEEERQIITVDAFQVAEKRNQDMKAKLIEVERERKKKKVLPLPWIMLRGKPKASKYFFATSRINWSPLKSKLLL